MPITVELQEMHSYSPVLLIIVGIILAILLAVAVVLMVRKASKSNVNVNKEITIEDREQIKARYLGLLAGLENQCRGGKISNRKAYQELSKIARNYIYETTGVKVQNYTLDEIKGTNMSGLYNVVSDCYAPEFSIDKDGDIYDSISKARKVVEGWS